MIQTNAQAMGVSDPVAFLVPGTGTTQGAAMAQQQFSEWAYATPGLNGGFIWQFGDIMTTTWADAVTNGLAKPSKGSPSSGCFLYLLLGGALVLLGALVGCCIRCACKRSST